MSDTEDDAHNTNDSGVPTFEVQQVEPNMIVNQRRSATGASSLIYKAELRQNRIIFKQSKSVSNMKQLKNELDIYRILEHHEHIPHIFGYVETTEYFALCIEQMDCTLNEVIMGFSSSPIEQLVYDHRHVVHWMQQLALAVSYLHQNDIVHKDIKPQNVLMGNNFLLLKLADFGSARNIRSGTYFNETTARWTAPHEPYAVYDFKDDIYSIGIIFWQLLARKNPFFDVESTTQTKILVSQGQRPVLDEFWNVLRVVIQKCWDHALEKRWTASQLVDILQNIKDRTNDQVDAPVRSTFRYLQRPGQISKTDNPFRSLNCFTAHVSSLLTDSTSHKSSNENLIQCPPEFSYNCASTETQVQLANVAPEDETDLNDKFISKNNCLTIEGLILVGNLLGKNSYSGNSAENSFLEFSRHFSRDASLHDESLNVTNTFTDFEKVWPIELFKQTASERLVDILHDFVREIKKNKRFCIAAQGVNNKFKQMFDVLNILLMLLQEFLASPKQESWEKFERQLNEARKTAQIVTCFEDCCRSLQESFTARNYCDHEDYVKLYRAFRLCLNCLIYLELFAYGANWKQYSHNIGQYCNKYAMILQQLERRDKEKRKTIARDNFILNVKPGLTNLINKNQDCSKICEELASSHWSDTNILVNHYWVCSFHPEDLESTIDEEYCHIEMLNGTLYVVFRRSFDLEDDPACRKEKWNNYYPEKMKTIDFGVRDELSQINVLGHSLSSLVKESHRRALIAAEDCKVVITTGHKNRHGFCSFGTHPNVAGRVIRMFGNVSIFIGF